MSDRSSIAAAKDKAQTLSEALPYLRNYRDAIFVLKVGGEIVEDPERASLLAHDIALMSLVGIRIVVVHGGGPQVSRAMEQAGVEPKFKDGLRVTDAVALELVMQVLIGSINPRISQLLTQAGAPAFGMSGFHAGTVIAEAASAVPELGFVGRVAEVDTTALRALISTGFIPVVAPVAVDDDGGFLNVNADEVAGAIAAAFGASKLVFLSNTEGIYRDLTDGDSLISELNVADLRKLLPSLTTGMRPKAAAALAALDGGVPKVHILDGRVEHALLLEVFTEEGIGTQVVW